MAGVIGVDAEAVSTCAPAGATEALDELRRDWETLRAPWRSPLEWLTALAESGNGVTVEYSSVQDLDVDAASLDEALRAAYRQVRREYGMETTPGRLEGDVEIVRVGDWK